MRGHAASRWADHRLNTWLTASKGVALAGALRSQAAASLGRASTIGQGLVRVRASCGRWQT